MRTCCNQNLSHVRGVGVLIFTHEGFFNFKIEIEFDFMLRVTNCHFLQHGAKSATFTSLAACFDPFSLVVCHGMKIKFGPNTKPPVRQS